MENSSLKCRGCLKEEQDMNSLYLSFDGITTFAEILEEALGYTVPEEEYSNQLCSSCSQILIDFMNFKTSFQQATEYFKDIVSGNLQDINPNIIHTEDFIVVRKNDGNTSQSEIYNDEHYEDSNNCELPNEFQKSDVKQKQVCVQLQNHENIHSQQKEQLISDTSELVPGTACKKSLEIIASKKLCKICKQSFLSDEFDLHFETHKIHICQTCGYRFFRKTDLNDHEEIHLDICKYVCQHCGKAFKVRTALNKHRRIHTNPREEICDVCGQRFNTRDTLKTHYKLKHLKSKDFQCNLCGLAFTLKSTLEKHIERHNPNRKRIYSCNLCDVSYINKYNLSRHHIVKHTAFENRPTCEFCGKRYIKKADLTKHLRRHHTDKNVTTTDH